MVPNLFAFCIVYKLRFFIMRIWGSMRAGVKHWISLLTYGRSEDK